jgi:hypothetical protein
MSGRWERTGPQCGRRRRFGRIGLRQRWSRWSPLGRRAARAQQCHEASDQAVPQGPWRRWQQSTSDIHEVVRNERRSLQQRTIVGKARAVFSHPQSHGARSGEWSACAGMVRRLAGRDGA